LPADNIFENNLFKHFVPSRASKVEYFFEYIDFTRFPMSDNLSSFFDFLRRKYRSTPLDLIITVNNPAFDFILKNSHDPFFQVPIIFSRLTENKLEIASTLKNASMLIEDIDIIGNIDLVLKIHPDLRKLIFITDFSSEGLYQESRIKSLLKEYDNKYEIILLKPSREKSLTQQIENISGQAAIFYFPCRLGAFGEYYMPMEILESLTRLGRGPVYSFWDHTLGYGVVGGFMIRNEDTATVLSGVANELLQHGALDTQIIRKIMTSAYIFDWRELQRWKIDEKQLPAGSIILFREPTIWNQYKIQIFVAMSFIVAETLLILLLLLNRTKRLRAETALRQSEKGLQLLTTQLINAQESERRRVSIELHDELGQALMTLKLQIRGIQKKIFGTHDNADPSFNPTIEYIGEINDKVRRLARDLSPSLLEDLGLAAALRWMLEDASNQLKIKSAPISDHLNSIFKTNKAIIIFRIFQEALTNIRKHSEATMVNVTIDVQDHGAVFTIEDNGKGFDLARVVEQATPDRGLGLLAMAERARMAGGTFEVSAKERAGTRITFNVPFA
jgi:signal transduction histidine kinase